MSKVKISTNGVQCSVKINDQEINDLITNISVNINAAEAPTITITLAPCKLEINGESFDFTLPKSTPKEKTVNL